MTENFIHRCNGKPCWDEKKLSKVANITIVESTEKVYHFTTQNLCSVDAHYNENKN